VDIIFLESPSLDSIPIKYIPLPCPCLSNTSLAFELKVLRVLGDPKGGCFATKGGGEAAELYLFSASPSKHHSLDLSLSSKQSLPFSKGEGVAKQPPSPQSSPFVPRQTSLRPLRWYGREVARPLGWNRREPKEGLP
jgi:hypothetical protein